MPRECIWGCKDNNGDVRLVPDGSEHEACIVCRNRKKRQLGMTRSQRRRWYNQTALWNATTTEVMKEKGDFKHEKLDAVAEKAKAKQIAARAIEKARANSKGARSAHA